MAKSSPYFEINGATVGIFVGQDGAEGGIVPQITDQGLEVTVHLICNGLQWPLVAKGLFGYTRAKRTKGPDGTPYTAIIRTDPISLPTLINGWLPPEFDFSRFICTGTDGMRGIKWRTDQADPNALGQGVYTGMAGWGYYGEMVIPARFAAVDWQTPSMLPNGNAYKSAADGLYDPSGFPYTTTRIGAQGEVFVPPHGAYQWPNGDTVPEGHIGLIRAKHEVQITRRRMPFVPLDSYAAKLGHVNDKPIVFGDHTFQQGTLMFLGVGDIETHSDISGYPLYDITLNFLGNGNGDGDNINLDFNYIMNPRGVYQKVVDSSPAAHVPFKYEAFARMIWPDYFPADNAQWF